jgi:formate C-acetyltransferase
MLGYGVDPRAGTTREGIAPQMLSAWKLPYHQMNGGYASHIGIQPPAGLESTTTETRGEWMRDTVIRPLFRHTETVTEAPYYVYFNIDSASHLRKVLADPAKYAPTGVYIMRIHGTFVNFLDLSASIQEDIIRRLEPGVTA